MATVYFQLEGSKTLKDGTHPIYFVAKFKQRQREKRVRYYTGRSATKKHWIGVGAKKRVASAAPGSGITNERLESMRQGADAIITNAQNLKVHLTPEYFKTRFETEVLGREVINQPDQQTLTFFEHLQRFIDGKTNVFQPATIKTYNTLKNSLQEFEKITGYHVAFETIDHQFITLYTKYLIEETEVLNNTLAKRIATLKAFLREMNKPVKGVRINPFTEYETFEASRNYDTTIMYLTEGELMLLQKLDIQPNSTADHVRDAFCFASHTGLRFSDWSGLTRGNIVFVQYEGKTVQALKFTMYKVHKEVIVPLDEYALSIIEKYNSFQTETGRLFPVYSNQETNRTLKEIAKAAKINDVIIEVKKSGAKRKTFTNPKHEILTCHDARNTMATLYLEKGGRPEVLKKLLGHSDIKQTMRYVKITEKAVIADHIKITAATGKVVELKQPA